MIVLFALFIAVHGLIHVLGFVKAFGWLELPQLTQPISAALGVLWLIAALLFVAAAGSIFVYPRWWWAIGAAAIVVSMPVIVASWADARFGALANLVAVVGIGFGFLAHGPNSLRAVYEHDVDRALVPLQPARPIAEADLVHLPAPVRQYLLRSGVVGHPRVRNFHARMHGRIRNGPEGNWMTFSAEQYNVVDEPARLFYLNASMWMIPAQGYHRYVGPSATMRVLAAAVAPVVDLSGIEMDQSETVTMFNDMCIMAPATLVDPAIAWEPTGARSARATFTNAGHTIRAELLFDAAGDLIDFRSDDRYQGSADGKTMTRVRWSTPLASYRSFDGVRLASGGEGRWHEAGKEYAYIEITLDEVRYNLSPR